MKNLAVVLATLCIFAQATTVFQTPAFLEIKSNPFGHSIASLVELNLSTGQASGRLDAIAEVLNTVEAQLLATQEHNDAEIQRERGWCNDQITNVKAQIEQARNDLNQYLAEQSQLNAEQAEVQSNLTKEQQTVAQNQENLDNAVAAYHEEDERYAASSKDYAEAIAACEQGLELLSTLRANPSGFIQSKARFGNVVALLQRHLSNKSSSFVQPVLNVLTELASSTNELDQVKLAKVVSLIEQLLQELRNQNAANDERHINTIDNLTNTISNLEVLIKNSNELIAQYQGRLAEIADRLSQLEGLIAQTQEILDADQAHLQELEDTCAGYDQSYATFKNEIDQQIATLQALKEYFKNKVVPAVENVRDSAYEDTLTVPV